MDHISRRFAVGKAPRCAWGSQLYQENLDFLDSFDPSFFLTTAEAMVALINQKNDKRQAAHGALGLRLSYSHAIETLLALLAASAQAPDCVVGWMCEYRESHIQHVLKSLNSRHPFHTKLLESYSWDAMSEAVHSFLRLSDKDKEARIKREYARFWARVSNTYMKDHSRWEYNSIKHGLRVRSGGYTLMLRSEASPGVPDPDAPVHTVAASEYGSSFFVPEPLSLSRERHIGFKHCSVNWQPQALVDGIEISTMSMTNVISFLKAVNGVAAESVQFSWPADLDVFSRAWYGTPGYSFFTLGPFVDRSSVRELDKETILSVYSAEKGKNEGDGA